MESRPGPVPGPGPGPGPAAVRRKSCLLRIRENCPFRKLRRKTYDVSSANSSAIGSYWNNISLPSNKPINVVSSEPLPSLNRCHIVFEDDQSEGAADVHMEEDPPAVQIHQNHQVHQIHQNHQVPQVHQNPAEDCMDLGDGVDPETGERAQG